MYIAEVIFWGQDKGGRYSPPQSGFKPQVLAGDVKTSCTVTSMEDKVVDFIFDRPYIVKIILMFQEEYGSRLVPNSKVALFEGSKQIGEGKLITRGQGVTSKT